MNLKDLKIDDFIDFHVLFMTMCILVLYHYVMNDSNIIIEKKNKR